jgi:hypothetical protein
MEPRAYGPFPYSPIDERPRLEWPGGARLAVWVIPNIEVFALDEAMPEGPGLVPDVSAWGIRDYGNRVGVFRMIEVMARYRVRGTVALNAEVLDVCPAVVERCLDLGWEMMGHCQSNTRRLNTAGSDAAAAIVRATLARIESFTGRRPKGWLGAGRQETWNTLDHLVAEGCTYTADWDNDDQPVVMTAAGGRIVSLPYGAGVSDKRAFEQLRYRPEDFTRMVCRAFDVLYREGAASGRVLGISLHPYLIGVPHRIDALDEALAHICAHERVWLATGEEIVDHFLAAAGTTG